MKEYDDEIRKTLLEFNQRIIKLRKEHNYSYKKLEELTGISRSTLQRYESNVNADIPMNKIHSIADAYGVSPSYLMGWESRELPLEEYKSIIPFLEELNYKLTYHSESEKFSLDNNSLSIPISVNEIKNLKESTLAYFKFQLSDIVSKPPTTE